MTKVGTGYVEIKPDFSGFGEALRAKLTGELKAATAGLDETVHKKVKVDVDKSQLSELRSAIGNALGGAAAGVGGLLGNLPVIGGLFQGLTSAFGTSAIGAGAATAAILGLAGVLAGLVASLGAAVAGAAALGVALAAVAGPVIAVTIGAFIRFAEIIKAVKDHESNAGTEARGLAGAQQQLQAATDAVAQAQQNLGEQAVAANQAWRDSIENVKDDLLGVKDAQLGIDDANLSLREAQQALKDFQRTAGGPALNAVFKKFTDVNVDESGLKKALAAATKGQGLSADDNLKLERLILNIRQAKLNEAHATDTLHDANTKLKADRKTEADFLRQGIAAYKPYKAATQQLVTAQRNLATAQRGVAGAAERQTKAWKDLTPVEKTFGKTLIVLGDTFKKIFTPVMNALLPGVTKGLGRFAKAAADPRIGKGLVDVGKALGTAFADIAEALTRPEMRKAFAQFAETAARLVKTFATKVFIDLALALTRLATVTLPLLVKFLDRVTSWFDGLEKSSRNTQNLRDDVQHVVDVFNDWVTLIGKTATALLAIGKVLEPIGTAIVKFLSHPLKTLGDLVGATKTDMQDLGKVFEPVRRAAAAAIGGVVKIFKGMNTIIGGVIRVFAGILTGDFREAWNGVKTIFHGAIKALKGIFQLSISPFAAIGKNLGKAIINGLIGVINIGIRALDKVLGPRDLGPIGHSPDLRIGEITPIGQHKSGVTIHTRKPPAGSSPGHAPSGRTLRSGPVTNNINITTPDGNLPDGRAVGEQILRAVAAGA